MNLPFNSILNLCLCFPTYIYQINVFFFECRAGKKVSFFNFFFESLWMNQKSFFIFFFSQISHENKIIQLTNHNFFYISRKTKCGNVQTRIIFDKLSLLFQRMDFNELTMEQLGIHNGAKNEENYQNLRNFLCQIPKMSDFIYFLRNMNL